MRVHTVLIVLLILLGGSTPSAKVACGWTAGAAGSPSGGVDISGDLLDRFRPAVYFVDDVGPGGSRVDYPCSYVLDDNEIEEAGWFTVDNLPPLPGKISIARKLIDWFLVKHNIAQRK